METPINLGEVDSLEAIVIIDNELDPLSPPAPNTVQVSGNLGAIAMGSTHKLTDRGEACRELRLGDVCCAAHGLSILVVSRRSTIQVGLMNAV
jgi:7,8-dihydropterin-6-yl-methyl-4-(beta-D-ribofuranosyl)aminobenzene 5'-phosphate synthase